MACSQTIMVSPPTKSESTNATVPEASVKYASPPFDDQRGDIILQSSDQVKFRVSKFILTMASSVFSDMFSLPQPPSEGEGSAEIPVIPVSESRSTLDIALRICYPIRGPQLAEENVLTIINVLVMGLKYNIDVVIDAAEAAFRSRVNTSEEDAVIGYAVACSVHRYQEAQVAATASLRWPASDTRFPELALMTGLDHFDFLDFRRRASSAVENLICRETFYTDTYPEFIDTDALCYRCQTNDWKFASARLLRTALTDAPLDLEKVTLATISDALPSNCSCKNTIIKRWDNARGNIVEAIQSEVAKVRNKFCMFSCT